MTANKNTLAGGSYMWTRQDLILTESVDLLDRFFLWANLPQKLFKPCRASKRQQPQSSALRLVVCGLDRT